MKVRWTTGSIRFRITPTELELLRLNKEIKVDLAAVGNGWQAAIAPCADGSGITFDGGSVTLSLSAEDIERLCEPEAEGVYFCTDTQPPLRYFVEKDFPCIHPKPEEAVEPASATFTAPSGFAERHLRGAK